MIYQQIIRINYDVFCFDWAYKGWTTVLSKFDANELLAMNLESSTNEGKEEKKEKEEKEDISTLPNNLYTEYEDANETDEKENNEDENDSYWTKYFSISEYKRMKPGVLKLANLLVAGNIGFILASVLVPIGEHQKPLVKALKKVVVDNMQRCEPKKTRFHTRGDGCGKNKNIVKTMLQEIESEQYDEETGEALLKHLPSQTNYDISYWIEQALAEVCTYVY